MRGSAALAFGLCAGYAPLLRLNCVYTRVLELIVQYEWDGQVRVSVADVSKYAKLRGAIIHEKLLVKSKRARTRGGSGTSSTESSVHGGGVSDSDSSSYSSSEALALGLTLAKAFVRDDRNASAVKWRPAGALL